MEDNRRIEELEILLLEDVKAYSEKLDAVVSTWKYYFEVANDKEAPEILNQVFPPLYRAAVRIILHGDWPRLNHVKRRKFTSLIKRSNQYLYRKFPDSAKKCKALTFLWVDPWDNPTLRQILEKATAPDDEVCEFMSHEGPELLFLRLEAMCEGKCEDLALQLAACYLKHLRENDKCHDIDIDEMNDVFIALLYKFNKKTEVIDMLKRMKLTDGIKLVKRISEKSKNKGRLWKHFEKMHAFALKTLIDMAMDICLDLEEDRLQASQVMDLWINVTVSPIMVMDESLKQVTEVVRRLIGVAGSAKHIYLFTQVIHKKYGDRLKLLCIELYIRGLTLNLNEIEGLKAMGDEKLIQANKDLADGFLQLAELFSGNESVCRECILSSFALNPTKETLQRIQMLLQVEDSSKPTESCVGTGRLEKCTYHDKYNCTCSSSNFIAVQLDQDILKSAPHLPDDLELVLSRSRPKDLTWSLGKRLDAECQKYLKNYKGPELNKKQELQYLNIDYSQFKDWPKEEPVKPKPKPRNALNKAANGSKPGETVKRPRGRPRKDSSNNSPVYKKVCRIELSSDDSSMSQEGTDDPDYIPEIDFKAIKPATHSVGTSVSLPRPRRESSTQTESPSVAAKQTSVVRQIGGSPPGSQKIGGTPSVLKAGSPAVPQAASPSTTQEAARPPATPNKPVSNQPANHSPPAKQMAASHVPRMTHTPISLQKPTPTHQPIPLTQSVDPPTLENNAAPTKNGNSSKPTQRIPFMDCVTHRELAGSPSKCTAVVSSLEFSKPVRTYFNRKTANQSNNNAHCSQYLNNRSPKPAEVPPTASSDIRIQEKLKPILKSLDLNPKVVLEDILSVNRTSTQLPRESAGKAGFPDRDNNLDILAQAVMRSDILLAKSVPGMNSVEMIVPGPQETAVNVVQISNSAPVLSQPAVTTVVASSSLSHSIHTSNSSIIQANPPASLSRLKTADGGFQADCSSTSHLTDKSKSHEGSAFASTQADNSTSPLIPASSAETRMNPIQLLSTIPASGRNVKSNQPSTSELLSSVSDAPCTSQQEGTLITAHIQRVGQPMKQRGSSDVALQRANSTNQGLNSDEINKIPQGQVFRLIVKDGRVVEQYYQGNQSLEPVLSIPDSEETESLPNVSNSYNHDHFIKLLRKKNDLKTKQPTKPVDNPQVSSLPKFHHVFGRQIYQSDTISLENSPMSSHSQYEERSNNPEVKSQTDMSTTGLSKAVQCSAAVQTILKDTEPPTKTGEKQRSDVQSHLTPSVLPTSSSSAVQSESKDVRHSNEIPSSSGVIFTCKVPISLSNQTMIQGKPVTILKTASTSAESQCSKVDHDGRSKDSVIRSGNMNALLAAALQSSSPIKHSVINNPSNVPVTVGSIKHIKVNNAEGIMMQKLRMPTPVQKNIRRTTAAQPSRYIRPMIQVSTGNSMTQTGPPVVTIPLPTRTVVLATSVNQNTLQSNLSKIDNRQDHLNSDQPSVSSTTLEQLREFESVLEQVTNTSQMKERGNVKKVEHQPTQTTSTDFPAVASKMNPVFQSSLVSTISDLNNESVSLTFINKNVSSTSTSMGSTNQSKIAASTPVVVVQSCSRPLASPALSITSQSSLSPAPQTSPAHISSKIGGAKVTKPKVKTSVGKTAPTTTIKVSPLPKPQQKPQEDEQTTQRIYAILDKYAEQLRNSPELKNKPAPRRRSNPPTNPTQSSKRKKSSHNKSKSVSNLPTCSGSEMSPGSEDLRTLGSEDSSNGVSQLSQVLNSPQSRNDEHSNPPGGDVSSEASESLDSKDQRSQHRLLLTEPSSSSGRTVLVQENIQPLINVDGPKVLAGKQLVVGSGATVPLTLSLPAGNVKQVIFPVPADGRPFVVAKVPKMYRVHQVTMPTGSPLLATAGSGAVVLRQMCLNKGNSSVKQVKLPVVSQIQTHGLNNLTSQPAVVLPSVSQSFTLATSSALDGDSLGITLDNTILLNTSTSQSLGFFQRNVTKSVGSQQSPNLLIPTSRAALETDNTIGQFSANSDLSANVKCDNAISNTLITTVSDDQNKSSGSSSQNPVGFKNDELRFSVSPGMMGEKQPVSSPEMATSNSKNWTQMLENPKDDDCLNIEEQKTTEQDLKIMKAEFHNINRSSDAGSLVEPIKTEVSAETSCQGDSVIKTKMKEEPQFTEGQGGVKTCLNIQQDNSQQWQFNLAKVERTVKDIKTEASGQDVKSNSGILINNINHGIGVKRKLNVENTIFQVAFKRTDRLKLVKDEFMHQRNSTNTLEREIRLQKSLSEECEDLGVDKPRTSELFPEAELLLDSDPLSRDSLQELYSRGIESSSSSHDSPLRSSPTVLSENSRSKFSSLSWKKQKGLSHVKSTDSTTDKVIMKLERSEVKSESSCESSPLNGSSEPSNSTIGGNGKTSNFKPRTALKKDSSLPSSSRDEITTPESDNCHFSEVEDSCIDPDLMDSEGESDSDTQSQTCKQSAYTTIEPMHENESNDKTTDFSLSANQKCNKCSYNKDESFKGKLDTNLQWFKIEEGPKDTHPGEESNRNREDGDATLNGILLDDWNSHRDDPSSDLNLRRSRSGSSFYQDVTSPKAKKKKKPSIFVASGGEDSSSSMDTLLAGGEDDLELDSISRRASSRGRVKKGCPCFNGAPDPKKKKDLSSGPFVKTDKPCVSKSVNFPVSSNKKTQKLTTIKSPNKKR